MTLSTRAGVVTFIAVALAVLAGLMAVRAFANGNIVYCDNCRLPSDGAPASSNVYRDFYYNELTRLTQSVPICRSTTTTAAR